MEFIAKAKVAIEEWMDALGIAEGMKVDKLKYVELSAAFYLVEAELFRKKELTYEEKAMHALFDVVDRNSNGYLSPDEYKELMSIVVESMTDEDIQLLSIFLILTKMENLTRRSMQLLMSNFGTFSRIWVLIACLKRHFKYRIPSADGLF